ncbi:type II secretion system protein GspM [Thiomicrorhabdus sp. zzn3]|uniref:type II secretion system protein GspM n=1 Tax=Thiomicrorhabdus sp. zzn3 TaxID=3039775 RepID=UPI0024366237|nr:type II secretion system protein GspM [Thiomicrorhabdus sp. zzn3]MDG6777325.1 type II secretion system protein GspM [Thiomicrorhabdus sp. zzn3]
MWSQIEQAWSQLAERERKMVLGLAVFLLVTLFYVLVWQPLHERAHSAQQSVQRAQGEWQWLREEVIKHPRQHSSGAVLQFETQSQLMATIQRTLRDENLQGFMESITPSKRAIRVSFKSVPAPRLFRWLSGMEKRGLISQQLQIVPVGTGMVEVMVSFEAQQ